MDAHADRRSSVPLARLVIIGSGGFGREVFDIVNDINAVTPTFDFLGFVDDGTVRTDLLERLQAPFLGRTSRLADIDADFVIGIGSAEPRRRIDEAVRAWGRRPASLRHPTATIGSDVQIGEGTIIAAGARLTTHIVLGRHAHLNMNCTVGHDVTIEDFVTVFGGVNLGGGCVIEEGATLGSGSVVLPMVRVGRGAMVGAGAIVARDVEPHTTVVGPGARPTLGAAQPGDSHRVTPESSSPSEEG